MSGFLLNPFRLTPVSSDTDLYNAGDQCSSITGGWSNRSSIGVTPTYILESGDMNIYGTGNSSGGCNGFIVTANAIDLTNFTTLHFEYEVTDASKGAGRIRIGTSSNVANSYTSQSADVAEGVVVSRKEATIDVSALNGNYYIGAGIVGGVNNSVSAKYYKIWLT